jgi:predicted Zn-dependent protease
MSMHSDPTAPVKGALSDGRAPVSTPVRVTLDLEGLRIESEAWGVPRVWSYRDLEAAAPLKSRANDGLLHNRRHVGETLYLEGPLIGGRLAAKAPQLSAWRMRLAGMKPGLALVAVVAAIVAAVSVSGFSPAQTAAKAIPEPARTAMGRNAVQSLVRSYKECETPASRAALQRLTTRLARAARKDPLSVQVRVLNWGLVNAFAMPGGQIVLTRGLLQKAGSADEVAGVLAHEMGHALELHPETGLVRTAGLGTLAQLLFAGSAGTVTNIGVFVTEVQYTRLNESEADAHAVRILRAAGISAKGLSDFFKRLNDPDAERSIFNSAVVRTHPLTKERIAFVESQPRYAATPALSADDWEALRSACGPAPADPRREDEQVVADASRALAQNPNDVTQLQRRARALTRLNRHAIALQDWDRVIVLRPRDSQALLGRAANLEALARHDEALAAYDKALELSPGNAVILNRRALAKRTLKRYDEALRDFDGLIETNPNFTAGLFNRGLVLLDLKRPDDALRAFSSAIALDKDYTAAYTHRGIIHMDAGRKDAAIVEFRLALAAQGTQASAAWGKREARAGLAKLGAPEKP